MPETRPDPDLTRPEFWQDFAPPPTSPPGTPAATPTGSSLSQAAEDGQAAFYADRYPAPMPDGRRLMLPLRDLGDMAVAGLIANQAGFPVVDALADWMASAAAAFAPQIVVGLPTLGHVFGAAVARRLGHHNWAALGTTRKLWYDESLSVALASITAPDAGRRLWLDPRLLPRLTGRRVLLVDNVVSTGSSARAGLALLRAVGVVPVAVCVAMAQGNRWLADWPPGLPLAAAFATPLFRRTPRGWQSVPGTVLTDSCVTQGEMNAVG